MSDKVAIIGVGHTKFGELWDKSWIELVEEAGLEALEDAGIGKGSIDKLFLGNMSLGMFGDQEHSASKVYSEIFESGSDFDVIGKRVEGACSSGGLALETAYNDVLAGIGKGEDRVVLVGGVEKMTDNPTEETTRILSSASDIEREIGFTFPALYATLRERYLYETDATDEDFDRVVTKTHKNASLNDKAQYSFEVPLDKVKNSPDVATPTKLFNASGIADGAAVVILTTEERAEEIGANYILLEDIEGRNDSISLFEREDFLTFQSTKGAAEKLFEGTGYSPQDVDIAEVHDCFSVAEVLALEDIGFYPKKKAWKWVRKSLSNLEDKEAPIPYVLPDGEKVYVNTSGGLKAKGHPVGATGIAQAVEITEQLRGNCSDRQVEGAEIGLTHNVGGSGGTAILGLYRKPTKNKNEQSLMGE